jgi:hypothetical protein
MSEALGQPIIRAVANNCMATVWRRQIERFDQAGWRWLA